MTGPIATRALAKIRAALGGIFPILGMSIVGLFVVIMLLDTPKKEDIELAESELVSARELRDLASQNETLLYNLERIDGRLRSGEMERASADFKQLDKAATDARTHRDQIRAGRTPIWASVVVLGVCVVFLRPIYKAASIVLMTIGLGMAAYFFLIFNTAINGVHNLGLLQDRLLGCIIGLAVFITGMLIGLLKKRSTSAKN